MLKLDSVSPETRARLHAVGFKLDAGGAHISRTMMLAEITQLLASSGSGATANEYREAVLERNALGKRTHSTREKTLRHLRELYGLSDSVPLFVIYRELVQFDPPSVSLLSFLIAWSRDPLFRATTPAVESARAGKEVKKEEFRRSFLESYPTQYSALNVDKVARNAASSWTQSGHLSGRTRKIRRHVEATAAALTLALLLAHVAGSAGELLFSSVWCRLLDLNPSEARVLAAAAHREGLITMRGIGSVVEVSFPRFKDHLEGRR